jgi:hypothetical protein
VTARIALVVAATLAPAAAVSAAPTQADDSCPASNPPNEMVLRGGSGQTAQIGKPFAGGLQVALANSNGCPLTGDLAGVVVTFSAPDSGASATFASSGSNRTSAGTDDQGSAMIAGLTANDTAGTYTVTATSSYGSVSFSLTNTATGVPAAIRVSGGAGQRAVVGRRFRRRLAARVTDALGKPVQGVVVNFSVGTGTASGPTASFLGGGQAAGTTDADGVAISPPLLAGETAGRYMATASTDGLAAVATYRLRNLPGPPRSVTAGLASGESTAPGARFPIPLAVTVADAGGNPVAGAVVTFSAPRAGPSGRFHSRRHGRVRTSRVVHVMTNHDGVAVAPAFYANRGAGGYVVRARVEGDARAAAFALVNQVGA